MIKKTIPLLVFLLLISACSSPLSVHVPQGRFDLPENVGKGDFKASANYTFEDYEIVFSPDYEAIAVDTTNPLIVVDSAYSPASAIMDVFPRLSFSLGYGLSDRFELGLNGAKGGALYLNAQLLGKPQPEATEGNVSLAVNLAWLHSEQSESANGASYKYEANGWDLGLIGGYRFSEKGLLFASLFRSQTDFSGKVSGGSVPGPFAGSYLQNGYSIGVHFNLTMHWYLDLEIIRSEISLGQTNKSENFEGFRLGYQW